MLTKARPIGPSLLSLTLVDRTTYIPNLGSLLYSLAPYDYSYACFSGFLLLLLGDVSASRVQAGVQLV